jgi:hypothetical protein
MPSELSNRRVEERGRAEDLYRRRRKGMARGDSRGDMKGLEVLVTDDQGNRGI